MDAPDFIAGGIKLLCKVNFAGAVVVRPGESIPLWNKSEMMKGFF